MLTKATIVFIMCMVFFAGFSSADQCIECSSKGDPNCAQNPGLIKPRNCEQKSNCYVRVVDGGETLRGCIAHVDQRIQETCVNDTLGKSCFVCDNADKPNACNDNIFPQNRLRCHTCLDNDLKGLCYSAMEGNAQVCRKYGLDDRCFTRKTAKSIERGCLSATTACTNPSHCLICPGEGCNNLIGNHTTIPLAPNSATGWTSTVALLLVPAVISLQFTL